MEKMLKRAISVNRTCAACMVLPVLFVVAMLMLRPVDSYDVWWHLNSGIWMLDNLQVMDHDIWSYTVPGGQWVNVAWLFQVVMAVFYHLGGNWGLLALKLLLILAVLGLFWQISRRDAGVLAYLVAILILAPFMVGHFHLRPHMAELILLGLIILLGQARWSMRHVGFALLILVVWANMHASAIVGATALAFQAFFGRWVDPPDLKARFLIPITFLLPLFITPYTTAILDLLLAHGDSESIDYYVSEWVVDGYFPQVLWLAVVSTLLAGLLRPAMFKPVQWFLFAFFLVYALKFKRFEVELALIMLLPVSVLIQALLNLVKARMSEVAVGLVVMLFMISSVYLYFLDSREIGRFVKSGKPVDTVKYPHVTTRQLTDLSNNLGRKIRVLNEYGYGGYLTLHSDDRVQVYVDGRMSTVYPERYVIPQYENNLYLRDLLVDRYDVDGMLLNLNAASVYGMGNDDWVLVGYDQASVLYVRRQYAEQFGMETVNHDPSHYSTAYSETVLKEYIEVVSRYLDKYPDNSLALNHLAVFKSKMVRTRADADEVLGLLHKAMLLDEENIFSKATLALLYARWKSFNQDYLMRFIEYLPASVQLTADVDIVYDRQYAHELASLGLLDEALQYLYPQDMGRRRRMDSIVEVWLDRGRLHHAMGQEKKALNCLSIASEMTDINNTQQSEMVLQAYGQLGLADQLKGENQGSEQ